MADRARKSASMRSALTRPLSAKPADILLGLLGASLGVVCALFPWYIFLHQEQFGIRAMRFTGGDLTTAAPSGMDPTAALLLNPLPAPDLPSANLDLFATGTPRDDSEGPKSKPGLRDQPFPNRAVSYRLIHVENGRAMIEDEVGIYVVERGSVLPDDARVTGFERRAGGWVMLTSDDRVVELTK